jgi:hypothetical protein
MAATCKAHTFRNHNPNNFGAGEGDAYAAETIVVQGEVGESFFIVMGPEDDSEVVLSEFDNNTNTIVGSGGGGTATVGTTNGLRSEKLIKHVGVGGLFGEKALINPKVSRRQSILRIA